MGDALNGNENAEILGICGVLANAAYSKGLHPEVRSTIRVRSVTCGHVSFSVYHSQGWTILAITGTDEGGDWGYNCEREFADTPAGIRVHGGFKKFAEVLAAALTAEGPDLIKCTDQRLLLTGHSLGGAAAIILPLVSKLRPHAVVTFGAPKCMHAEDTHKYPHRTVNARNLDDVVPWVPLARRNRPWGTPGEVYYLTGTAVSSFPGSPLRRFAKQLYSLGTFLVRRGNFIGIHDHQMTRYLKNISGVKNL